MLLAELEIWHSRPIAPTRRVALGRVVLPTDPAPGFGGLLLGAVVAAHMDAMDPEAGTFGSWSRWTRGPGPSGPRRRTSIYTPVWPGFPHLESLLQQQ